ncbi:polysaccharide deacetylase family protein [Bdellovibrio sp. HCB209]|uniref:polysaccharide deacetylase family protein n=1 Tax=Bdellovibrio sp. HCB209 TaxID=3394354 RepID=UPI0039B3CD4D
MLRRKYMVMVLGLGMMSMTACSSGKDQVKAELQDAVVANEQAETKQDWHASESNPENLFPKWKSLVAAGDLTPEDVCSSLHEIAAQDLTLMEEQLDDPEYDDMLKGCKDDLLVKIDNYALNERATLTHNLGNFFEDDQWNEVSKNKAQTKEPVQYAQTKNMWADTAKPANSMKFAGGTQIRDTSAGYKAVSGDIGRKEVILTFDDGPSTAYTRTILATLRKMNAKAMFFQLGKNIKVNPELVKEVAADGHAMGAHSMTHRCLGADKACMKSNSSTNPYQLSFPQVKEEINGTFRELIKVLGWADPFFRFPYGNGTAQAKAYLKQQGIGEFFWNVDSLDWKAKSYEAVVSNVMNQVKANSASGRGSLILMHDIQRRTAEALPEVLAQLHGAGYNVVLLKSKNVLKGASQPIP